MPIELNYFEDEQVIYVTAADPVTLDEMTHFAEASKVIHDHALQPIFTLLDASTLRAVPQGAMRGRSNPEYSHAMAAGVVIFGANLLVRTITSVVARLAGMERIYYFEKADEAWAFVRSKVAGAVETASATRRALPHEPTVSSDRTRWVPQSHIPPPHAPARGLTEDFSVHPARVRKSESSAEDAAGR